MPRLAPFFLPGCKGYLFCHCILPDVQKLTGKSVLLLPPFAEEMNKSRRNLSQLAWKFAEQGYSVYLLDLYGTGDSEGDFSDATWEIWRHDIAGILQKMADEGVFSISVVAMRMGSLLLESVFDASTMHIDKVVLWQPAVNGEILLNQFFRLKLAADMLGATGSRITAKEIKQDLAAGNAIEIAGYSLNPMLASGLSNTKLENISFPQFVEVVWYEIVTTPDRGVLPASQKVADKLIEAGTKITLHKITGPHFWSAVELVDAPDLINATIELCV